MAENQKGSISDVFINRPVMTILLSVTAILFGVYAFTRMPVNDLPGVDYPVIQVSASYPGADPQIMASNIASPLEQQFMQIPGLEVVTSTNTFGASTIILQFAMSKDISAAATDVQSAIQRAMGNLPPDIPSPPSFKQDNPNDMPIYLLSVASDSMDRGELYDYAFSQIAQRVSMIKGVSKADMYAAPRSVRVYADTEKLFSMGMTLTQLKNSLSTTTNLTGSGNIEGPNSQFVILPNTQLSFAEDYRNIVVTYKDGSPVFLRDVATVVDDLQSDTLNLNFQAKEVKDSKHKASITIGIRKTVDGNAVETVAAIEELMKELQNELPESIELISFYNRAELIVSNIEDVKETLLIAFVLVVIVIFLFLGRFRDTAIPAAALPFSLLLTFILMNAFGFSINNLSLMGLTMAIGFLVDDAIVFLENTVRRMEDLGEKPLAATFASAREISFTILSMTLSLAAVFIPLVFMSGVIGRVFREFSVTVVTATLMSGLISLTLTPMMCSRMLQARSKEMSDKTTIERMAHRLEHAFLAFYNPTLRWMLRRHIPTFLFLAGSLFATYFFFTHLPSSLLPVGDSGLLQGGFFVETKTSPKEIGKVQDKLAAILDNDPAVKNYVLISGITGVGSMTSNMGMGFILLNDKATRPPIAEVSASIRNKFGMIPGVFPAFQPMATLKISTGATSQTRGNYAYAMSAMDQGQLNASAMQLMMEMMKMNNKLFVGVNSDLYLDNPQIVLEPFRDKASMLGLSANSFTSVFKDAYAKFYYYLIKSTYQQYWTILQAQDSDRSYAKDLNKLNFTVDAAFTGGAAPMPISVDPQYADTYEDSLASNLIPFESIAYTRELLAPVAINHLNNFPSVTIFFNLAPGVSIGEATKWIDDKAEEIIPRQIQKGFQGEAVTFQETMMSLVVLIFVAIFVMYVILGILYESYVHPITVLIALPIAVAGGLASLYALGMELNIYSMIGLFMLMGIVKKNGIMMVDFAIMREEGGLKPADAVHEASMERFRPIIMTTMAALIGMLPIALGWGKADAESRIPLGVTVVGGLIFSQIVTLYMTPVVYLWMDWLQSRVLDKVAFFQRGHRES